MSVLGVNSDLAWLQATDGSARACHALTVHSTLPDKVCQAPPVLCFICVHTTQSMSALSCFFPSKAAKVRGISIILESFSLIS